MQNGKFSFNLNKSIESIGIVTISRDIYYVKLANHVTEDKYREEKGTNLGAG